MSANYTLAIINPQVTGNPSSVVYTGVSNVLELTVFNHTSIGRQIGGSPGTFLLVQISDDILDADGAKNITAAAPWTVASVTPPSSAGQPFTLSLQPSAGPVSLPGGGGSVTLTLQALTPSATGRGLVGVQYKFDQIASDNINLSRPVFSQQPINPDLQALIGDNAPLQFTLSVNNGPATNPLMVSAAPLTPDNAATNAVANALHFKLEYVMQARLKQLQQGGGGLVPSWNPLQPPTFRVFCPYNMTCDPAAPEDLTDCVPVGSPCYNGLTSAYQIPGTLNPTNPQITTDGFWQIAMNSSPYPVWELTPTTTAENPHLFTPVETMAGQPGPFLHWYLVKIVTTLIAAATPETPLYLQWTGFPGFNDGILAFPLAKALLAIQSFTCKVQRKVSGPELIMEWTTIGADHCLVSGDEHNQQPQAQVAQKTEYVRLVTSKAPMQSTYTLTAVSAEPGLSVTQTLSVRWAVAAAPAPVAIGEATTVRVTPDGTKVLVLSIPTSTPSVGFHSPTSLNPLPLARLEPADGSGAQCFAIAPDGGTVYVVSTKGGVYGYPLGAGTAPKNSGAVAVANSPPYFVGVSPASDVVGVVAQVGLLGGGTNELAVVSASDLATAVHAPVLLSDQPSAFLVGPRTGRYYVGLQKNLTVLDPSKLEPVPGSGIALVVPAVLGVSPDEQSVYCLYTDPVAQSFALASFAADTLVPESQMPIGIGYFGLTLAMAGASLSAIAVSADSTIVFVIGLQLEPLVNNQLVSQLSAYDAASLSELPWSPVQFGDFMPIDLTLSPDGSRLYAIAGTGIGTSQSVISLYAVDPAFV